MEMFNGIATNQPFLSLMNYVKDLIICVSLNGEILAINSSLEDFIGINKSELIGQQCNTLFDKLQINIFATKNLSQIIESLPIIDLEYNCQRGDNRNCDVSWSFLPLLNANQITEGLIMVGRDMTELKKLSLQVERLDNIIKYAPDMIYWKDKNSIHLGCNDQFSTAAGYENREDVIGKSDYDFPWSEEAAKYQLDDKDVIESGTPRLNIEDYMPFKNGKKAIVITNKVPLRDSYGQVVGVLGIATDITERKKTEEDLRKSKEEAEAASQAKTEFLQNMRHDIRTPLTGITGFANLIAEETNDPKVKEYRANLTASTDALLKFMNEILEMVRFAAGEAPVYKNKFDLKKRIQDVIDLNQAKAQEKHIEMTLYYDPTLPQYVVGDSKRIHRIIMELVANALNFTNQGRVNVSVRLAEKNEHELIIKILIEDTGIGIPLEKQHEIFARFKRLHPSFEGIYKGAGLGLAFVHQLMDDIKGEIYVESKEGKGSTFICIIPICEALLQNEEGMEHELEESNIPVKASHKALLESVNLTDKSTSLSRVLVVEDQEVAARVAKNVLQLLDCDVDIAVDGQSAIKMANENSYDLIFMDVGLPDISGMEATKRIRIQEWNTEKPVPIIALTAHVDGEDKQRCIEAGMSAVLSKPLAKSTARDMLDAFIPMRAVKKQIVAIAGNQIEEEKKLLQLSDAIVDVDVALQMSGGNEDFLHDMLNALVDSFEDEKIRLSEAYQNDDWKSIGDIAHKIKGGCSYCGASRLKEAGANLEHYLKADTLGELKEALYQQMLTEMDALKQKVASDFAIKHKKE